MEFFNFCDNNYERTSKSKPGKKSPQRTKAMKYFTLIALPLLSVFSPQLSAQYPGDLVISEYMANPEEVADDEGEYIELYNTAFYPVNLNGCVIQDGSGLFVAPTTDVWIQPGEFAVAGAGRTPYAAYYYPASPPPFSLNNMGGDLITVTCGGVLVAATSYSSDQEAGTSMELAAIHLHNNGITQESHYGPASTPFRYNGVSSTDYGSPGFAGNTFVLPVELASFEAELQGRQVLLKWSTLTESNNSHFMVEHSTDGQPFLPLGRISGAGDSQQAREYAFLHAGPEPGLNYYRLQQVDFDGAATYSEILSAEVEAGESPLSLYPTAVDHTLAIEWRQAPRQPLHLYIFNMQGNVAASLKIDSQARRTQLSVDNLPPGAYLLAVPEGGSRHTARFFKK